MSWLRIGGLGAPRLLCHGSRPMSSSPFGTARRGLRGLRQPPGTRPTNTYSFRCLRRLPSPEPSKVGDRGITSIVLSAPSRAVLSAFLGRNGASGLGSIVDGLPTSGMQFRPLVRSGPIYLCNALPTALPQAFVGHQRIVIIGPQCPGQRPLSLLRALLALCPSSQRGGTNKVKRNYKWRRSALRLLCLSSGVYTTAGYRIPALEAGVVPSSDILGVTWGFS